MADHPSVEKRYRQSVKRRTRNIEIKSKLRTLMKKTRLAIETKNHEVATSQIQDVNKALGKAVSKGIVKKNTASRWLSRLSRSANRSQIGELNNFAPTTTDNNQSATTRVAADFF